MKKRKAAKVVRTIVLLVILALVGGGVYLYVQAQNAEGLAASAPNYDFRMVSAGDVQLGVTAKGSVSTQETTDIVLEWSGDVKEVNFEVGDIIAEGDTLAVVEDDDLAVSIRDANSALQRQQLTLQQQQDSLSKEIAAPASGRIKSLEARLGEDASQTGGTYGQLCMISPDGAMLLTCELTYEFELEFTFDIVDEQGGVYVGEVVEKGTGKVRTLEIRDDKNLEEGEKVTVYYKDDHDWKMGEGEVTIKNPYKVTGSGELTSILIDDNQMVQRGDILFTLDTQDALLNYESQSLNVSDAQRKVAELRKDAGKSELLSPAGGVITNLTLKAGTFAGSGQSVATIQDVEHLETVVSVDELDIAKIEIGQPVEVTFEALTGKTYTGTVSKIAVIGINTNNFATFPVTIVLDPSQDIKIGMSCEVTIEVDNAKNAVRVPIEALQRGPEGYQALVVTGGLSADMQISSEASAPEEEGDANRMEQMQEAMMAYRNRGNDEAVPSIQTEPRVVEVGLVNEDYAEILSGLKEGDVVAFEVEGTSTFADMMMMGGGGGGGAVVVESGGPAPR